MHYRNAQRQQIVGDDTPMTAPPHSFRTHDGPTIVRRQRPQLIQTGLERFSYRVFGIVPEGGDMPERIERRRRPLFPVSQPTKSRQMSITSSYITERSGERIGVAALNCGWVRERGIDRTSTPTCWSKVKTSAIGRVEWPIVKIIGTFLDRRARFVIMLIT